MKVYKISVPTTSGYDKTLFFYDLYFHSTSCPSKQYVIEHVEAAIAHDKSNQIECDLDEVADVLESCDRWPWLESNTVFRNTRVMHPVFGDQPLSCQVVTFMNNYPESEILN